MWFKSHGKLYWLIGPGENLLASYGPDYNAPKRPITTEICRGEYVLTLSNGNKFYYESWGEIIDQPELFTGTIKYPSNPSSKTLKELFNGTPLTSIKLDKNLVLVNTKGGAVHIQTSGYNVLSWDNDTITFWNQKFEPNELIEIFTKYAGKDFEFDKTCMVKTKLQPWSYLAEVTRFTNLILDETESYKLSVSRFLRNKELIQDYLNNIITTSNIIKSYGTLKEGQVVSSNCKGCRNQDMSHIILHIYRKEIPFFVMVSVLEDGPKSKDGYRETWKLIEDVVSGDTKKFTYFKTLMKTFLEECLMPRSSVLFPRDSRSTHGWHRQSWKDEDSVPPNTLLGGALHFNGSAVQAAADAVVSSTFPTSNPELNVNLNTFTGINVEPTQTPEPTVPYFTLSAEETEPPL